MPTVKQIVCASLLVLALLATAAAQERPGVMPQGSSTITAAATDERVRITAPSSVVQMHVEVYAASGEKLFDQEIRGGNVFDWHLQDGQAQRLAPGNYVCVVTAKSVSGRLTQKIGTVSVAEKSVSVQPAESPQLSAAQAQYIGPVEENSSWTVAGMETPQTPTVIAHDGTDGQMIRGRGALTFRIGNFFSGMDTEQMRLTEDGNLGIGTSQPQSKLDVAGAIRAERFLVVKPQLAKGDKAATDTQATNAADSVQPLASGSGTQDRIAKWTDNTGGLGDSDITETGGLVGIGTNAPVAKLDVAGNINTSTQYNIAGNRVLSISGTGNNLYRNTFVGFGTGGANSGDHNSFFGGATGVSNGSGSDNSFFGATAGFNNTSGNFNSFFGSSSAAVNQTGSQNSFFGYHSGFSNNAGTGNSFFGAEAGHTNTSDFNAFFGQFSGYTLETGSANTFIGSGAGFSITSGSNNTLLGANSILADNLTNATAIGANAVVSQSNSLVLGSGVNVGIGTTTPSQALEVANGRIVTTGTQTLAAPGGILEIGATVTNNDNQASGIRMRNTFNGNATNQQALDVAPTFAPSASIALARGFLSAAFFAPPPGVTITDAYGGNGGMVYSNTSGAITNGTVFAIRSPIVQGSLKPATQYGLHILNQGIAGIANSYGLFVDAQSGSTNNYSAVFADGNVGIGTTAPLFKFHVRTSTDQNLVVRPGSDFSGALTGIGLQSINDNNTVYKPLDLEGSQVTLNVGSSGNVGIGTPSPHAKLQVAGGSIYIANPNSLIITSPNGACWFITVANAGTLSTIPVPCP